MKRRNWIYLAIIAATSCFAAEENKEVAQMNQNSQMYGNGATGGCSSYSAAEQQFSSQLSSSNQMMFCNKFNSVQRGSAMQMTGQADSMGNMMTADQAVEKVARDNNLMMPSSSPRSSSSCPMK